MQIQFHANFEKRFRKLSEKLKEKTRGALEKFFKDPFHPSLKNHALHGELEGKRAFSVTGNLRVIFEEHENYFLVIMLDVGTHSQVY